jgi:hypothetical protein
MCLGLPTCPKKAIFYPSDNDDSGDTTTTTTTSSSSSSNSSGATNDNYINLNVIRVLYVLNGPVYKLYSNGNRREIKVELS